MKIKRTVLVAALAGTFALATAGAAAAAHTHVMVLPNGKCVILARGSGEAAVTLPAAVFENNPNVTVAPTPGRSHPLHVLVHTGVPGQRGTIFVLGQEPEGACSEFVNP